MKPEYIVSDFEKGRYWQPAPVEAVTADAMQELEVYPDCTGQTLRGFGGAATEAAAHCWQQLAHSVWDSRIEATAFRRPDGSRAAVLLNRTGAEQTIRVTEDGTHAWQITLAAGALGTLCWTQA